MVNAPGNERRFLAVNPEVDWERAPVKFRLTYEGRLESNGSAKHKHEIRKALHPQLRRLWEVEPNLSSTAKAFEHVIMDDDAATGVVFTPEALARNFQRNGFRFVPLATEGAELLVGLEILFLRYGVPGSLVSSGDIDNRLKTLFDALRMPVSQGELGGFIPGDGEDPFYVLLQDDKLINQLSVETDTLLEPTPTAEGRFHSSDARLVITVRLRPSRVTMDNMHFVWGLTRRQLVSWRRSIYAFEC